MAGPSDKVSIYNYIELGMTIIMAIVFAYYDGYGYHLVGNQFVTAITYGFLIINIIVVLLIFLKEDVGRQQRLCISGTGMIVFFLVAIILLLSMSRYFSHADYFVEEIIRELIATIAAIVAGVFYIFDFILNLNGTAVI